MIRVWRLTLLLCGLLLLSLLGALQFSRGAGAGPGFLLYSASAPQGGQQLRRHWVGESLGADSAGEETLAPTLSNIFAPHWSPDGRWIAFLSNTGASSQLYLLPANSQHARPLLPRHWTNADLLGWSPDSRHLLLTATDAARNASLYVIDVPDGALRPLPGALSAYAPAWSPDGTQIAYLRYQQGSTDLYLISSEGQALRRLTWDGQRKSDPRWSPDGQWLLYLAVVEGRADLYRLSLMDTQAQPERLTQQGTVSATGVWSPDGRYIFYRLMTTQGYLLDVESGESRFLGNNLGVPERGAWSPDGRYISYHWRERLYVLALAQGERRAISISGQRACCATWSPRMERPFNALNGRGGLVLWGLAGLCLLVGIFLKR